MEFELKDENGQRIYIQRDLPEHLRTHYWSNAENLVAMGDFGDAIFHCYIGDGFSLWYSSYLIKQNSKLTAIADSRVLELHISVVNQIEGSWDGIASPSLSPYEFSLTFTPHVHTEAHFAAGKSYVTCDIHFEKWFLQQMAADFPLLAEFLEKVEMGIPTDLTDTHFCCTLEMINAIRFVYDHRNSKRSYKHLLECKVKEILIDALERTEVNREGNPLKLSDRDRQGLLEAKRLIELEVDEMPSLATICSKTLLNEFKLKKGFKQLFGVSPYQYHVQLKMEQAKFLLLNTHQSIVEISLTLGYQYDNNFSIEFKKYAGCTPTYFRKHGKI